MTIASSDQLNTLLQENKVVIVDFYADWCPPCKAIAPKFEALSNEEEMSKIKFCKLNIEDLPNVGTHYTVRSIPTFIIFFKGKEVNRLVGASIQGIKEALMQQLEKLM